MAVLLYLLRSGRALPPALDGRLLARLQLREHGEDELEADFLDVLIDCSRTSGAAALAASSSTFRVASLSFRVVKYARDERREIIVCCVVDLIFLG